MERKAAEMKKQVIKKDNYAIVWTPRHRGSRVSEGGRLIVYVRILRSRTFENARLRALRALRTEKIEYTGKGFGLSPEIDGDYFMYVEPMGFWALSRIV